MIDWKEKYEALKRDLTEFMVAIAGELSVEEREKAYDTLIDNHFSKEEIKDMALRSMMSIIKRMENEEKSENAES